VNLAEAPYRRRLILADATLRVVEMREKAITSKSDSRNPAASPRMAFRLGDSTTELLHDIPYAISSPDKLCLIPFDHPERLVSPR